MRISDALLVRRLQAKDPRAFEEVVAEYYPRIYRQLWHLCADAETAADLTQETFVQAWRSLASFEGRSALGTWLYIIAVRVWRRSRETRSLPEPLPLEEFSETIADPEPDPAELLEAHALQAAVQDALHRLPPIYREAIVLFYIQEMKYSEIAAALDIPIGTVKSRLHTGLQHLRKRLAATPAAEVKRCH